FLCCIGSSVLFFSCAYRQSPRGYYKLSSEKISRSPMLSHVVRVDSLDLELLEWAVFHETNLQRQRLGLLPLKFEPRLQQGARLHSKEMIDLNYFDHTSPVSENETIKQRLTKAGIRHGMGGENIAIHPARKKQDIVFKLVGASEPGRYGWRNQGKQYTYVEFARDLVRRWLNSAPHRRNILSNDFKFLGVGAVPSRFSDSDVFYVTQNFSSTNF
ncbi:MAG: CAP domain-containing protein, partial [bacterium]